MKWKSYHRQWWTTGNISRWLLNWMLLFGCCGRSIWILESVHRQRWTLMTFFICCWNGMRSIERCNWILWMWRPCGYSMCLIGCCWCLAKMIANFISSIKIREKLNSFFHKLHTSNGKKRKNAKINEENKKKSKQTKTCVVSAGDEQKPLSLDSPGFKRIAGVINYIHRTCVSGLFFCLKHGTKALQRKKSKRKKSTKNVTEKKYNKS